MYLAKLRTLGKQCKWLNSLIFTYHYFPNWANQFLKRKYYFLVKTNFPNLWPPVFLFSFTLQIIGYCERQKCWQIWVLEQIIWCPPPSWWKHYVYSTPSDLSPLTTGLLVSIIQHVVRGQTAPNESTLLRTHRLRIRNLVVILQIFQGSV